jgi:DNA-binding NtrC family response regulator
MVEPSYNRWELTVGRAHFVPLVRLRMPYTILLVEDDDGVRDSTEAALVSAAFRLLVASNGLQALRLLENDKVDVLLTDVVMPEMSGIELAEHVREWYPEIKIMLMTGYSSHAKQAERLGKLLFKPVRATQMITELTELLTPSPGDGTGRAIC